MPRARGKCPKCHIAFDVDVEPGAFFACPGCGTRLKSRPAQPPSVTTKLKAVVAQAQARPRTPTPPPIAPPPLPPRETAPSPAPAAALAPTPASPPGSKQEPATAADFVASSTVAELMFALYQTQKQILAILDARLAPGTASGGEEGPSEEGDFTVLPPATPRLRHQKTVLLLDDDPATREAATKALQGVEIPVRVVDSVDQAIAAISAQKPDVLVLELDLKGPRTGKDMIDMVRATIEWINIPILLYTRAAIHSEQEARTIHGADAFVVKGSEGPDALVSMVITLFRTH